MTQPLPVPKKPTARAVVQLAERGITLIDQANTVDEAVDYRAQASAIEVVVRQQRLGEEAERAATKLRLNAERRIGELTPKAHKHRPSNLPDQSDVSAWERHEFRKLAAVPREQFDDALETQSRPTRKSVAQLAETEPKPHRVRHPARFSDPLMPIMAAALVGYDEVLDPFAGTGRVHELPGCTWGVELEPEWAALHPRTIVGNALALPFADGAFDAVCTSPTYGNRLADHHEARDGSERRSYRHDLGRPLHPDNSGALHWGDAYRQFHRRAWAEVWRVVRPGGRFVLNISDHVRARAREPVTAWHVETVLRLGWHLYDIVPVLTTARLRYGDTAAERPEVEYVLVFDAEDR